MAGGIFEYSDPIISKRRKGDATDPYVSLNRSHQVVNGKIVLEEIPDSFTKVAITGESITWYETDNELVNTNEYKVDYTFGIIYLDSSHNGKTLTCSYKGTGTFYFPASRIWSETDSYGDVTESLQEIITNGQTAITNLEQVDTAIQNAETATTNANNAATSANNSASLADTATTNANTATTNANQATTEANTARDNAQLVADSMTFIGDWDSVTSYKKNNIVQYGNEIFVAITDNTNIQPPNATYWKLYLTAKEVINNAVTATDNAESKITDVETRMQTIETEYTGTLKPDILQVTSDAQSLVDTSIHLGDWNSATAYVKNNEVNYNGSTWRTLRDNTNIIPVEGLDWTLVALKGNKGDKGATLTPRGLYDPAVTYQYGDLVTYDGSTYYAIQTTTGNLPTNIAYWEVFMSGGGDMQKDTYDTNNNGQVDKADDSDKLGGKLPSEYEGNIYKQSTEPTTPIINDLWIDTTTTPHTFKLYNGTTWIEIGTKLEIDDTATSTTTVWSSNKTSTEITNHTNDSTIHVTQLDKDNWNGKTSIDDTTPSTTTTWSSQKTSNEISVLSGDIGDKTTLTTTEKSNLAGAISEVKDDIVRHTADNVTDVDGVHGLKIEEGLWTPALLGGSDSSPTSGYQYRYGHYYKIGKMVHLDCSLRLVDKTGLTGDFKIIGIPFVVTNKPSYQAHGQLIYSMFTVATGVDYAVQAQGSSTKLSLIKESSNTGATTMTVADIGDTAIIQISIDYETN